MGKTSRSRGRAQLVLSLPENLSAAKAKPSAQYGKVTARLPEKVPHLHFR